jgi:hypothetical protein
VGNPVPGHAFALQHARRLVQSDGIKQCLKVAFAKAGISSLDNLEKSARWWLGEDLQ